MNNNRYLELQRKLGSFYFNKVQPKLELHNKIRQEKAINLIIVYCFIISAIVSVITSVLHLFPISILSSLTFAAGGVALVIRARKKRTIEIDVDTDLKSQLMDEFVKIFGDLHWHNDKIANKIHNDNLHELTRPLRGKANLGSNLANITPEYQQIAKAQQALYNNWWKDLNKVKELNLFNVLTILFDDCIDGIYENVSFSIKEITIIPPVAVILPLLIAAAPITLLLGLLGLIFLVIGSFEIINLYNRFITTIISLGASKTTAALIAATIFVLAIKFIIDIIVKLYRRSSTRFRGVVVEFAMNKDFEGHTFILDNTKDGKAINVNKNKYSEVKLEDVEFEKDYTVWSDNQIEARYLLTTTFIERLKNLKTSYKAKYTRVSFKDNKIVIAAHTGRDMFKMANAFTKTGKETFIELFNEIASVLEFIEQLKLNKKIGL